MNQSRKHTFDELLSMSLNEEVFDQILDILEQEQKMALGSRNEAAHAISAKSNPEIPRQRG